MKSVINFINPVLPGKCDGHYCIIVKLYLHVDGFTSTQPPRSQFVVNKPSLDFPLP